MMKKDGLNKVLIIIKRSRLKIHLGGIGGINGDLYLSEFDGDMFIFKIYYNIKIKL